MCPSYLASKDEKDVTRGPGPGAAGTDQRHAIARLVALPEVHESLDLCLSCKACASDCPAGVDMAGTSRRCCTGPTGGKRRPISHYTLGWLPRWLRGHRPDRARVGPAVVNRALAVDRLVQAVLRCRRDRSAARRADVRARRPSAGTGGAGSGHRRPAAPGSGGAVGRLVHRRARPGGRERRGRGAARRRLPGGRPGRLGLLRADLDHHRPARRCEEAAAPAAGRPGTVCGTGHSDRRAGAVVHRGAPRPTCSTCCPTIRARTRGRRRRPAPSPNC